MKNKLFRALAAGFLLVSVLFSCTKTEVDTSVYVDSYINSILDNGVTKYSVMHSAYSFVELTSVGVKGAGGTSVPLANFSDEGYSFYTPVNASVYTTAVPAADSYTYDVIYASGETTVKTNATNGKSLLPAQNLTTIRNPTDITLSWNPVVDAEAYKVRIFSADSTFKFNKLVFESTYLVPKDATSSLSIPFSLYSLTTSLPYLIFDVSAFIFEQGQDTFHAVSVASIKGYYGN